MMSLCDLTAAQALAGMTRRQFSAVDYVTALLERTKACAHLNAFSYLDQDLILAAAKASDDQRNSTDTVGPLHGLPIAIKDNINVAGQPTTAGTPGLGHHRPARDAPVIAALRQAGAILFGHTNMHELAYGLTSDNAAFGAVRNPHDPTKIPGGSSGGSAAAVAAGMVPVALGTDTGGSVRVPAALCGIVGFRPSQARYCGQGIVPISHSRDTVGVLARTVADVAVIDRVLSGDNATTAPVSLSGIRIGIPRAYFYQTLDRDVARVVQTAHSQLRARGAQLIEAEITGLQGCNRDIGRPIVSGEVLADLPAYLADHTDGIDIDDIVAQVASPDVRQIIESQFNPANRASIIAAYQHANDVLRPQLRARYQAYFDRHQLDVIAFPTTRLPATPIGENEFVQLAGVRVATGAEFVHNTGPASIVGLAGLSVPIGFTPAGLPVGLEFDANAGQDRHLMSIGMGWQSPPDP